MADSTRSYAMLKDVEERVISEMDRHLVALLAHMEGVKELRGQLTELQNFVRKLSIHIVNAPANEDRRREGDYYTPTPYTKLDFPSFSISNIGAWVAKCERYFSLDGTPEGRKTLLASIALNNDAYRWFQYFECGKNGNVLWGVFVEAIRNRFGPLYEDPMEDLMQLRQTGALSDYQRAFDNIMCQVDLPVAKRIGCFIGGLKPKVAAGVKLLQPQTLLEASKLARLQEANLESLQGMTLFSFSSQVHQNFSKDLGIDSIPVFEAVMNQDFESLFALEGQSHDALVPTLASETQSSPRTMLNAQASGNDSSRMVRGDVVNGSIVYSRQKKARRLFDGSVEIEKFKRLKTSWEPHANVHIPTYENIIYCN